MLLGAEAVIQAGREAQAIRDQSRATVEARRVRDDAVAGLNSAWSVLWATTLDANMQSLMSGGSPWHEYLAAESTADFTLISTTAGPELTFTQAIHQADADYDTAVADARPDLVTTRTQDQVDEQATKLAERLMASGR